MFLEIGKPWESFVAELALVGGVLGGAESEGWLGLGVGSVGRGGGGGWRRRWLRRRRRPRAARRAAHTSQRLCWEIIICKSSSICMHIRIFY